MMKIEYDKEADAAYVYLDEEIKEGQVKKSEERTKDVILDFDEKGRLLGVEILNASKNLSKHVLRETK
ncbi:MAG: DUF2283 domain-containing protein [Nanoarchaeota archaeon]|nr:DUF2283 domain-containing protein [Nanoarchaeota archaeon]